MARFFDPVREFYPDGSGVQKLMDSLLQQQERKYERERQARMDAMLEEQRRQQMASEEEQRQLRTVEFAQKMAALQPRKEEPVKFEERARAGEVAAMIPDTPEERAAFETGAPVTAPAPQQMQKLTLAGQTIDVPMLTRTDIQEQQQQDFLRQLEQERQKQEILAKRFQLPEDERLGGLAGMEIPEAAVGQVFSRLLQPQKAVERTVDLGDKVEYIYTDGSREVKPKGRVPAPPAEPGAMSPEKQRALFQVTTKFQSDTVMQQAGQGATIKAIADNVIANPSDPTKQLSALYILVKNLDPTSAVREGELSLAQATQSYLQQYGNMLARVAQGRVMSPDAAVALAKSTKEIAELWDNAARRRENQYRAQAGILQIGPEFEQYLGSFSNTYSGAIPTVTGVREVGVPQ